MEKLRKAVRPVLADVGETAQFFAMKHIVLDGETRDRFLDYLYEDLAAVFQQLMRISRSRSRKFGFRGKGLIWSSVVA